MERGVDLFCSISALEDGGSQVLQVLEEMVSLGTYAGYAKSLREEDAEAVVSGVVAVGVH